jgi:hypothetical protein
MTNDDLKAIEVRAREPKMTFRGAPLITHADADNLDLIAEVRRLHKAILQLACLPDDVAYPEVARWARAVLGHNGAPVGCTVNAPEKNTICVEPLTTRNS